MKLKQSKCLLSQTISLFKIAGLSQPEIYPWEHNQDREQYLNWFKNHRETNR